MAKQYAFDIQDLFPMRLAAAAIAPEGDAASRPIAR